MARQRGRGRRQGGSALQLKSGSELLLDAGRGAARERCNFLPFLAKFPGPTEGFKVFPQKV